MSTQLRVSTSIHEQLRAAMLEEADLVTFLGHAQREQVSGDPQRLRCTGTMPVRRTEDLETSELRRVEVELRWRDEAWDVVSIHGIEMDVAPQ